MAEEQPTIRKGVLLVHGMGMPDKGAMLRTVVNSVANWMARHPTGRESEIQPRIELAAADEALPRAQLFYGNQEWEFVEAWWAGVVEAPLFDPMVGWTAYRFMRHLGSLLVFTISKTLIPTLGFLAVAFGLLALMPITMSLVFVGGVLLIPLALAINAARTESPSQGQMSFGNITFDFDRYSPLLVWAAVLIVGIVGLLNISALVQTGIWRIVVVAALGCGVVVALGGVAYGLSRRAILANIKVGSLVISVGDASLAESRVPRLRGKPIVETEVIEAGAGKLLQQLRLLSELPGKFIGYVVEHISAFYRGRDELPLLTHLRRQSTSRRTKLSLLFLLGMLSTFHLLNSCLALGLYTAATLLIVPAMFLVWVLSLVSGLPGVPKIVGFIKRRLDAFLLGSLGDIKVFMDEPIQARNIRAKVEEGLEYFASNPHYREGDVYVVAHSTGCAIAYEALALRDNSERIGKVAGFITVGSILNMIWGMGSRRPTFDLPLPEKVKWVNIWTRYDPALGGPISDDRVSKVLGPGSTRSLQDVLVTNQDDISRDHSSYWENHHQVIPKIVEEVWGHGGDAEFAANPADIEGQQVERVRRKKRQVLALTGLRLIAWYAYPVSFLISVFWLDTNPSLLGFASEQTRVQQLLSNFAFLRIQDWPIIKTVLSCPYSWGEACLVAAIVAAFVTVSAHLLFSFLRAFLWDALFQDIGYFKP